MGVQTSYLNVILFTSLGNFQHLVCREDDLIESIDEISL